MTDPIRITVKAFLPDGTKLAKVIWVSKAKEPKKAIMNEFDSFVENLILRIPL